MSTLPLPTPNSNYYPQSLLQYMLYQHNLQQLINLLHQIQSLKTQISSRQKKHRRCDKDIIKEYKCEECYKMYGSEVALKLHLKLKHKGDEGSTDGINQYGQSPEELLMKKIQS